MHRLAEDTEAAHDGLFPTISQAGLDARLRSLSLAHLTHQDATKGCSSRALALRATKVPRAPLGRHQPRRPGSSSNEIIMYTIVIN